MIIFGIIFTVLLVLSWLIVSLIYRKVVPTNMVHIVQSSKKTIPYGRGKDAGNSYFAWPSWIPIIGVSVTEFPESIFQVNLRDYEAYDTNRLPFMVDIAAFFRVDNAETAAQRAASFSELNTQLTSVLQGAVRSILATDRLERIMEDRASLGEAFTKEVENQIKEWGVLPVKSIEFMDIRDANGSKVIENIMAKEKSRIDMESRTAVASNNKEAKTKEIEAERAVEVSRQQAMQEIGVRTAEQEKTVGIENEVSKQAIAEASALTAEKDMAVKRVNEVRQAEINKDVAVVLAEEEKQVKIVNAEAAKSHDIITSEGELTSAELEAKGIQAVGEAKAAAEYAMLQAPVDTQINLAKEIGENEGYQSYLIEVRKIEAQQEVGIESAKALQASDLKVIANSGDVQQGVGGLMDVLTPKGGTSVAGMLNALSATDEGKALVEKFIGKS